MLNEVAVPGNAEPWVARALADGRKIASFGHGGHKVVLSAAVGNLSMHAKNLSCSTLPTGP